MKYIKIGSIPAGRLSTRCRGYRRFLSTTLLLIFAAISLNGYSQSKPAFNGPDTANDTITVRSFQNNSNSINKQETRSFDIFLPANIVPSDLDLWR